MHITPVLRRQLHCRVEFKLAILVSNYKALHGLAPRCTSPTTLCWWLKSVDVCDQLMHGHYVSYRGPGPSLITGALLWLDRRSGLGLYWLHCMTLTAFTASKNSVENIFCLGLVAAVAHIVTSLFFANYKYCYLLTYCYCYKSDKLLSQNQH